MEHITILILSGEKLCLHICGGTSTMCIVHCMKGRQSLIPIPEMFFTKQLLLRPLHNTLLAIILLPVCFLILFSLWPSWQVKKSLAGEIITLLRHVRTLRKWDGIALITKCSCSTYFRMGTVTPTWWDLRPWRKSADLFATWRSPSWAARRVLLAEWRQRWLGVNNNPKLGANVVLEICYLVLWSSRRC